MRDPREGDGKGLQQFDEVIGGRFSFYIGGEGEDNLGKFLLFDASKQLLDAQIVGTHMIER